MRQKVIFSVRDICEIALLSAIGIVLGFFCEIKVGQNGGSIGFSMIPLLFICFRHGLLKGFIACGVIYGLSSCIYDGYGMHCYPLDYLLAYGSLAIVSLFYKLVFKNENAKLRYIYLNLSILIACFIRLFFHVISGMILWDTPFGGSFVYNILYVGPSCVLCMIVFSLLLKPLISIDRMHPVVKRI